MLDDSNSELTTGLSLATGESEMTIPIDTKAEAIIYIFDKEDVGTSIRQTGKTISDFQFARTCILFSQTWRLGRTVGDAWDTLFPLHSFPLGISRWLYRFVYPGGVRPLPLGMFQWWQRQIPYLLPPPPSLHHPVSPVPSCQLSLDV